MAITNPDPDSATTPDCNPVVGLGSRSAVSLTLIFEFKLGELAKMKCSCHGTFNSSDHVQIKPLLLFYFLVLRGYSNMQNKAGVPL